MAREDLKVEWLTAEVVGLQSIGWRAAIDLGGDRVSMAYLAAKPLFDVRRQGDHRFLR
jgi:hypothetical protein